MQQLSIISLALAALCSGTLCCKKPADVAHENVVHENVVQNATPSGVESPENPVTPHPPGWVLMDEKAFSFYAPPDMKPIPVQGVDSFVGEYRGESLTLNFDYGRFCNQLDGSSCTDYNANEEQIGGKDAKTASFRLDGKQIIGVYFPSTGEEGEGLNLTATGIRPVDYDTAKTIFRTIRFPRK
jgi:hypothetical protein